MTDLITFQGCVCGKANAPDMDLQMRIVGGTVAHDFQYPWHVGLIFYNRTVRSCGGSLITKQHVLTAAHCVTEPMKYHNITIEEFADRFKVILGAKAADAYMMSPGQDPHFKSFKMMTVSKIEIHPNYDDDSFINDFAILTFTNALKHFTYKMKPVCLPSNKNKGKNFKIFLSTTCQDF